MTSSINQEQKEIINSFLSITNTTNYDLAKSRLESVQWNLDFAISSFFDSKPPISSSTSSSNSLNQINHYTNFNTDDSEQNDTLRNSNRTNPNKKINKSFDPIKSKKSSRWFGFIFRLWTGPLRFLAVPVSLVADLTLTFVGMFARLVGLRLPSSLLYWSRSKPNESTRTDPRTCAERWIRELEEELQLEGVSSHSSQVSSSLSTTTSRRTPMMNRDRRLPDFLVLGYDEAVRKAKEELKILMVVLVSEEHDDVAEFKRTTLTNDELLKTIRRHNILVWGGDVRDRDACQAAQNLEVTTYPSIAFVALQIRQPVLGTGFGVSATRNGSSTQPIMSMIARLSGSCENGTSPNTINKLITETIVPRTQGFFQHLRSEKDKRESERRLREEQDRAYEEAGRRDQERVLAKQIELEQTELKRKEETQKVLLLNEQREKKVLEEEKRSVWRRWASKEVLPQEPDVRITEGVLKIGFRLGDGRRIVRRFFKDTSLESLYTFVEIESSSTTTTRGKESKPTEEIKEEDYQSILKGYKHEYRFKLSTAMPRRVLSLEDRMSIEEFGGLDGANINVEGSFVGSDEESEEEEEEEEEED
ncbi:uncharacterized protein MELLADRAFT_92981 [Melampsora larici-populina 98AG31]|uniref:UBX domain-containing protein n=1 Tax=Melampsora larici-populina (strain 98AG31 / pathotype 3-4-7) TaxID=747676 RepID=F4S3G3_MELLP|nr:uncharacterized protein MELLADRAFT_92981 [Melampsora larici-populina 98AG31]EGG00805.1 hypothetical protein MELLADRAFT_92981 [Melampsora larici-populina 98AG31]